MRQSINATFYTIIGRTLCLLFAALLVSGFELYTRPGFQLASAVNSLSQSSVLCMTQDSVGFLWIGTKDGLNRFDGYEFVTYKYDRDNINSLSSNEISCLLSKQQMALDRYPQWGINRQSLPLPSLFQRADL